ncbi:hypothetical protein [Variovorax paradoxus]|uniref:hypothetical protein n=1 Tax=Variovorax paradoxus TaxID=34073 RepID=UPI001932F14D|nr:hypothetical protein INQ48_43295 [Variovorax paradoxus]
MNDLERRLADIEARLAALEARDPSKPELFSVVNDMPEKSGDLVRVKVENKRFDPANPSLNSYEDHLWFDCVYTLSSASKPTRAVKGVLEFLDLFGEVHFRLNLTLNVPLKPGVPLAQPGTGFAYNQFMTEHQWMLATELSNMSLAFRTLSIIYTDGTTQKF